jgi:pimeloyl-ACP methyl ester carboxylesterase
MSRVDLVRGPLYYEEKGSGVPLLLVHGIPTDHRAWRAQIDTLAGSFRTIAMSRRYAQPIPWPGDLRDSTIENNASDLVEVIGRLGLGRVHLVGHSYGGFVAAYFALHHPELLRSLTLVEPAIASLLLRNPRSRFQALMLLLRHPSTALSAARFLRTSNAPALLALNAGNLALAARRNVDGVEDSPGAFDRFSEGVRQMMVENGRTVRETELPYPPVTRGDLARIDRPTCVVRGETGVLWLRTVAGMTARAIPRSELRDVPGAGHYPHLQRPAEFTTLLLDFLGRSGG